MSTPYLRSGSTIALKITRVCAGSGEVQEPEISGSWLVPHDMDQDALNSLGAELGYEILYEIAKQNPMPVLKIEIVEVKDGHD
jgi:hypothetical protein